jgi:TPR repeat protein
MKKSKLLEKAYNILHNFYASKDKLEKSILYSEYLHLIRKAAYYGNSEAQYELGQTYEDINAIGFNPKCNFIKARYWYGKACKQNQPDACNNLASMYDNGIGGVKDLKMALILYKKAMDLGNVLAKKNYKLHRKQLKKLIKEGRLPPDFIS